MKSKGLTGSKSQDLRIIYHHIKSEMRIGFKQCYVNSN